MTTPERPCTRTHALSTSSDPRRAVQRWEGGSHRRSSALFFLLPGTLRDALVESFLPFLRQPANLIGELIYEEFHRAPPEKHVSQYLGDQRDLCIRTALVWWTDLTPGLKPRLRTLMHANEKKRERVVSPGTGQPRHLQAPSCQEGQNSADRRTCKEYLLPCAPSAGTSLKNRIVLN